MNFNWLDVLVIAAFFVALLAIPAFAAFRSKRGDSAEILAQTSAQCLTVETIGIGNREFIC